MSLAKAVLKVAAGSALALAIGDFLGFVGNHEEGTGSLGGLPDDSMNPQTFEMLSYDQKRALMHWE